MKSHHAQQTNRIMLLLPALIFAFTLFFYLYEFFLRVMPSVMPHATMHNYGINARAFGNLSAIFYYVYAPMQLLVGLLLDRYGPRWILSFAVLLCAFGGYVYAGASSLLVADIGRFLLGFGSAFAFVGVLKLAILWLPSNRFAFVTGVTASMGMLGGLLSDLLLTRLIRLHGLHQVSYIIAVVGAGLAVLLVLVLRSPAQHMQRRCFKPRNFRVLGLAFIELVRVPQIWINGLIGCLFFIPLVAFTGSWQIPYLEQTHHFSRELAADATALVFFGWVVGAPFFGWLSEYVGQRRLPITVGACLAAILLTYIIYVPNVSHDSLLSVLFLFGFFSSVQILVFPISRELSRPMINATAFGLTNAIVMLSGSVVFFIGFILDFHWHGVFSQGLRVYTLENYQVSFLILPISLVLAVFLTFFVTETNAKAVNKKVS